jgi:hypothetical protein
MLATVAIQTPRKALLTGCADINEEKAARSKHKYIIFLFIKRNLLWNDLSHNCLNKYIPYILNCIRKRNNIESVY